eukprot:snap_masked-scaffold_18-processed-gene-1.20-mRNA-1 protein AED:1.00 eAED:1.00 QI:0/-1/0/0/-1/1/1/0/74
MLAPNLPTTKPKIAVFSAYTVPTDAALQTLLRIPGSSVCTDLTLSELPLDGKLCDDATLTSSSLRSIILSSSST